MAIVGLGLANLSWQTQAADKDAKKDSSLSALMRKKLDAGSQILEGLTVEDSELILKGANSLLELSKAEKWQMLIDADYRQHNSDFRGAVRKLATAAEKGKFDNAALQWIDTMKACIECHQDVRHARQEKK